MNTPFPFGFGGPTALYYTLYAVTLAVHAAFLCYVLAGSAYVAFAVLRSRVKVGDDPLASMLREWLPFALGLTITAGVAPLLFLQLLYKRELYSSNLLLSHRWMIMLPILIGGFYLLYLIKTERYLSWPRGARGAIALVATGAFVFTGYTWTENHLVGLREAEWAELYASGRIFFGTTEALTRFSIWLGGSLPIMATLAAWQIHVTRKQDAARAAVSCGCAALLGLLVSGVAALVYGQRLGPVMLGRFTTPFALPYLVVAAAGLVLQLTGWIHVLRKGALPKATLVALAIGASCVLLGTTVVREAIRTAHVDVVARAPDHARIAESGGFVVFVVFFLLNALAIAWIIKSVNRALPEP